MTRFWSELGQDVRCGCRTMIANKVFSALAVLSLAFGVGANTAVYSFMESNLLRSLPVADPESLVVLNWHSRPPQEGSKEWVVHGLQGIFWPGDKGVVVSGIFLYGAFETLREENPLFSMLFGYFNGRNRTLVVRGQAAGRLIDSEDDRPGAAPVAVISFATSQNRFGGPPNAIGQSILVDSAPFTVIGVALPEFFGADPAAAPNVYLPLHTNLIVDGARAARMYSAGNFYWIDMMASLRPGVSIAQAQATLAPRFHQWVAATATTDGERAKLPTLMLNPGAAVSWMVLRRVLLLGAVGLAISVPAALIGTRLVKSFLFETQPNDPGTLVLAGVVLLSAVILAGYAPARRASRVDPLEALRHE